MPTSPWSFANDQEQAIRSTPSEWIGQTWQCVLLLTVVALAARAVTFGNPIVHVDEQFYLTVARLWRAGALPYVDVWDRKPIGLFLLYRPAAAFGYPGAILAYQAMALASVVATASLVMVLARRCGWRSGAVLAGVAYILWLDLAEGQGGQAPVFYNLPMALAAVLVMGEHGARRWRGLAGLAMVGLAITIKTSVLFEGMFFGLWAMWRHWRMHRRTMPAIGYGLGMIVTAAMPTLVCALAYAQIGAFGDWWYANVVSILHRRSEDWVQQAGNLAQIALFLSPLLAAAALTWRALDKPSPSRRFVFIWLVVAVTSVLVFGGYFDHYALPIMLPMSVAAAGAARLHTRRWLMVALIVVALGGQVLLLVKRANRGSPAQFSRLVDAVGRGPGCLYVYSGPPMLYTATGRCRMTRWIFPSHLSRDREEGAVGVDQTDEMRRIFAARPAVVVMADPYAGERLDVRRIALAGLAAGYAAPTVVRLGGIRLRVFAATNAP